MHTFKWTFSILLYAILWISNCQAAEPYQLPRVSIPTDARNWMLCDPVLPYWQKKIFIMPEDNDQEFISIEFFPRQENLDQLYGIAADENIKIYTTQHQADKKIIALEDQGLFKIHMSFQGKAFLYNIYFECPAEDLEEEERYAWIERFGQITESPHPQADCLIVTPFEVMRKGSKIKVIAQTKKHTHPSANFSMILPVSWLFQGLDLKLPGESDGAEFTMHRFFARRDELIAGSVATARYLLSKKPTEEELENNWKKSMKNVRQQKIDLITEGSIINGEGAKGNYMVTRVPDGSVVWQAFYFTQYRTYLITIQVDGKNFKATGREILSLLKNFSFSEEHSQPVEGTDQKSKKII
ncbi:MAG: hypothetical protein CK425_02110 [Parachlamydia sp.]|nr:MAG: hypothetical protein CK425_02110 [Parachlamydia sp.]